MKRFFLALTALAFLAGPASAAKVGVAMERMDDGFLKLLQDALIKEASASPGVDIEISIADSDANRQIEQIKAFIDGGFDAVIFQPVNDEITDTVNQMTADAGVPLVYVNRTPPQLSFPGKVSIVTCNELVAGRAQMRMLGSLVGFKGSVVLLRGADDHPAAAARSNGVKEVLAQYPDLKLAFEESGQWSREEAEKIVTGLLERGTKIDIIAANNDQMALGAIDAYKKAGADLGSVVIGGVDGTPNALAAMQDGDLEVSLLQSAPKQAKQALMDAVTLANGQYAQLYDWVAYELIVKENLQKYASN